MGVFETKEGRNETKAYAIVCLKGGDRITDKQKKPADPLNKKSKVNADSVLELLADIAFTSPARLVRIKEEGGKQKIVWKDIGRLPDEVKNAIASVKNTPSGISVETLDRMKAIDLLMKYMGLDRKDEGPVVFEGENELEE